MRRTLLSSPAFARDLRNRLKSRPDASASNSETKEHNQCLKPLSNSE